MSFKGLHNKQSGSFDGLYHFNNAFQPRTDIGAESVNFSFQDNLKEVNIFCFNPTWAGLFLKSQGWGGGAASRPAVEKHEVSQKRFVHFT